MFRPVSSGVSFPKLEEKTLAFWKENRIFERSLELRQGKPRFVLYEGPPTANGSPGVHHVLSRAFKDVIPRYKVMKGYYAPRIAGWDTHGLPVELEVEKELGFSGKAQIEAYGVERFNAKCRESVFRYLKDWNALTERIAFWVDLEHPYVTMHNDYIESVWWAIKQMWDKGLIYQGYRVTPHCPRCGTSLSSHEVALGYQDNIPDTSVYIKFRIDLKSVKSAGLAGLLSKQPAFLLAWTTTPWTLPANTALAVASDAEYAIIDYEGQYLVLAAARLSPLKMDGVPVVARIKGSDLVGMRYEPLYNPADYSVKSTRMGGQSGAPAVVGETLTYPVISGKFVSMEDGTGIVHIAPAYGEVDYDVGEEVGLDFVHTVDLQGRVIPGYPFAGKFVKEADPLIIKDLESRGLLFRSETIYHTYPFCWRCSTPLLYYAKQTWYIRTTAKKQELIDGNKEINWYPDYIKYGRFGDWLENNVDWAFSRERYWGTPLPVWRCESCGSFECIGGLEELKKKPAFIGLREPLDLHRPYVDDVTFSCAKCGGKMKRLPEVIDCWFDSGAMPIAQHHYPFENKTLLEDGRFPADYICEAVDQTRGWFYSLHAISTLLFDRNCFENVICLGHILDAKGEKMSKARGNVVKPWVIIDKYGADALRWYLYTSSPPGNVRRFDEKMISEVARRFMLILWNVYSFFVTYANLDKFNPATSQAPEIVPELDRWILSELNQLVADVDAHLDGYDPTEAGRKIENFVNDLSTWYVRRSRRRFWKSESDTDKLSAYHALYSCLVTLSKLLAPLAPFLAEELYQNLVCSVFAEAPVSVHLSDFPVADKARIYAELQSEVQLAMKVCSLGRAARSEAGIKVRQPMAHVLIAGVKEEEKQALTRLKPQVLEELNVKDIVFADTAVLEKPSYVSSSEGGYTVAVPTGLSPELVAEGLAREIVHRVQTMRRSAGFEIADHITTYYQGVDFVKNVMTDSGLAAYIKQETLSNELLEGIPAEGVFSETYKLDGREVTLAVRKVA